MSTPPEAVTQAPAPQASPPPYPPPAYSGPSPGFKPPQKGCDFDTVFPPESAVPAVAIQIIPGGCPRCRRGVIREGWSLMGLVLAVLCFPFGIICCLLMRDKKCDTCGYVQSTGV